MAGRRAEGAFQGHLYRLLSKGILEISQPVRVASVDFKKKYYCKIRGNNKYIMGWGSTSETVFVIAQVYPTGDCGQDFGRMGGYLMNLNGTILHRYGDRETGKIQNACWKSGHAVLSSAPSSPAHVQ